MLRLKLDIVAFGQCFHQPFWRFERNGISEATILEYAQAVLGKYGISEQYPTVYLQGAVVPHDESPEILRDGDLLRLVPARGSIAVTQQFTQPQAVTAFREICQVQSYVGGDVGPDLANNMAIVQHSAPPGNAAVPPNPVVPLYDHYHESATAPVSDANQNGPAASPDEEVEFGTPVTGSRKRRKRGPRRRVRTKRITFESDAEDRDASAMDDTATPLRHTLSLFRPQMSPTGGAMAHRQSTPHPAKTALCTENTLASYSRMCDDIDNISASSAAVRLTSPAEAEANTQHSSPAIESELGGSVKQKKKKKSVDTSVTNEDTVSASEPINSRRLPGSAQDANNRSSPWSVSTKSKQPMKMSARKLAKRSYGLGDLLQMLKNGENDSRNQDRRDVSQCTPLRNSSNGNVDQIGKNVTEVHEGQREDQLCKGDEPESSDCYIEEPPPVVAAPVRTDKSKSGVVRLKDLQPGARLTAGLSLFSEAEMGVRFFNDVTLAVTQVNLPKRQLYVQLEKGLLPAEYGGNSFKVDWAMLEGVQLLASATTEVST